MPLDTVAGLVLALVVIVAVARLGGALARLLGQPAVIGEIAGGILLGPTLFGGAVTEAVFPSEVRPALSVLANVGVCVFVFLIGLHLDRRLLRGQGRVVSAISLTTVALPFGAGALLALYLIGSHPSEHRLGFVVFLGTAMSVTAFPVLARILTDRGMIDTPIGGLALACAAINDVLAWSLLAVAAALAGAGGGEQWRILLVVPFAALLLKVVRPLLARLAARPTVRSRPAGAAVVVFVAVGLALSAEATEWMGLHRIFGAFLFGIAMPTHGAEALRARVLPWVGRVSSLVLLPVFFLVAGVNVNLSTVDGAALKELGLVLLVAIGGKGVSAFAAARAAGLPPRLAATLAVLLNTRGLTELIALTVGLQLGLLDYGLYSLMVVMALVTTAMAGVLLRWVYPPERVREDVNARAVDAPAAAGGAVPPP